MFNKPGTPLLARLAVIPLLGVVLWVLFRYVITDEEMVLAYVKALAWPLVAVAILYWLRIPLREKFQQLMRLEMFGGAADFSGQQLTDDLESDVDFLTMYQQAKGGEGSALVVPAEPDTPPEPTLTDGSQDTAQVASPATEGGTALTPQHEEDLRAILELMPAGPNVAREIEELLDNRPDLARRRVLEFIQHEGVKNQALRDHAEQTREQTRESVENIIRKSASWGYDMGRAGAPRAVPDVQWNPDGSWTITTEVPPATHQARAEPQRESSKARHIRTLEEDIKKAEREIYRHGGGAFALATGDVEALRDMRHRLRRLDPHNPYAQTTRQGF